MSIRFPFGLIAALAAYPSFATAQADSSHAPQHVSLADTVARARTNPPQVLLAIAQAHAAEAQIPLARAALLPTVTGTLAGSFSFQNGPSSYFPGASFAAAFAALDAQVTGRWTIWDFGRTALNVGAAQESARAGAIDVRAVERAAIATAIAAYYLVLADNALIDSLRETARQRARELDITRGLVDAGTHPPIERLRAEITLAAAQLDVTNAESTLRSDTATLAAALALDPARPVTVSTPPGFQVDDDPMRAADEAIATRPEIISARTRIHAAELALSAARAAWRPSFYAQSTGDVGYLQTLYAASSGGMPGGGTPGNGGGVRESTNTIAGLSVPIYDPTIHPAMRNAEANLEEARANLEQQTLSVRTDAATAAIQVRAAHDALVQTEALANAAAANLQQAEGRYAAGVAPLLELVDAQGADATARIAVVRARYQYELAKVRLITAIGRIGDLERSP